MAPRKFTVTHPDGSVSKRSSQNALYTFTIVREVSLAARVTKAEETMRSAQEMLDNAIRARAAGVVTHMGRPWFEGSTYVNVEVGGEWITSYVSPKVEPMSDAEALALQDVKIVGYREYLEHTTEGLDKARRGPQMRYKVMRWSRTRDLATKALSEFGKYPNRGVREYVVPVD